MALRILEYAVFTKKIAELRKSHKRLYCNFVKDCRIRCRRGLSSSVDDDVMVDSIEDLDKMV